MWALLIHGMLVFRSDQGKLFSADVLYSSSTKFIWRSIVFREKFCNLCLLSQTLRMTTLHQNTIQLNFATGRRREVSVIKHYMSLIRVYIMLNYQKCISLQWHQPEVYTSSWSKTRNVLIKLSLKNCSNLMTPIKEVKY